MLYQDRTKQTLHYAVTRADLYFSLPVSAFILFLKGSVCSITQQETAVSNNPASYCLVNTLKLHFYQHP